VIKWPVKLYVRFLTFFLRFFQNKKNMTFYVFLSCCTRFPQQCRDFGGKPSKWSWLRTGAIVKSSGIL